MSGEPKDNTGKKDFKLKISKKHIQGFIAGILVAAVIFTAGIMAVKPGFLTGTALDDEFGTGFEDNLPTVTKANFEQEVMESDKPVIVYYTMTNSCVSTNYILESIDNAYDVVIKKFIVDRNYNTLYENVDIPYFERSEMGLPALILFNNNKKIGQFSLYQDLGGFNNWWSTVKAKISKPTPTVRPTPRPTPTPTPVRPTLYRAFPKGVKGCIYNPGDVLIGELLLTPYDYEVAETLKCIKGITLPVKGNEPLYALLNGSGGNNVSFSIPDLSGKGPISGLDYYISTGGIFGVIPDSYDEINIGDFTFLPQPYETPTNDFYLGQVFLAKNLVESRIENVMVPCDGRALRKDYNEALFSLIGYKFGGSGNSFNIPNMTGNSPIDGAKYYILIEGIYPPHK